MSGEYLAKLKACCDVALYTKCAGVMVGVHKVLCVLEGPGVGRCKGLWCSCCTPMCYKYSAVNPLEA